MRAPPRLCLTTPEFPPRCFGGLARTAERVAGHARDLGFEVDVVDFRVVDGPQPLLDENRRTLERGGVTVHEILLGRERFPDGDRSLWDCPHALTLQMMYQSLELLHRKRRFQLFQSFFLHPVGYVTGLFAKRSELPHATCVVGNDLKKYAMSPERIAGLRTGLENSDRIVALSHELAALADALTRVRDKTRVVLNSVSIPEVSWHGPRGQDDFLVGAAGIFKYAKGLPYLLKAVAMAQANRPTTLDLAGEFRTEEAPIFRDLTAKLSIREWVRFSGVIPRHDMSAWLSGLDVFALSSISEGCPNILMEALAVGVPCVATRVGAVEELVEDRVSGLLVPWGDSEALAGALCELSGNPALAARLGRAGRERMRAFGPEREKLQWKSVWSDLVDQE